MIHVWEGMSQPCFVVPCSLNFKAELHVYQMGIVNCKINYSPLTWSKSIHMFIRIYFNEINFIYLSDFLHIVCFPACVDAWVSSCHPGSTVADVTIVRCWFLQSEGIFLPREGLHTNGNFWRNHATPPHPLTFFSLVANPQLCGAALVQEGNYLSTPITSIPAILLTSAPDESPLPTVQEFLDQSREWSPCTLLPMSQHMEYGMLCWQPGSASLHAKSHG